MVLKFVNNSIFFANSILNTQQTVCVRAKWFFKRVKKCYFWNFQRKSYVITHYTLSSWRCVNFVSMNANESNHLFLRSCLKIAREHLHRHHHHHHSNHHSICTNVIWFGLIQLKNSKCIFQRNEWSTLLFNTYTLKLLHAHLLKMHIVYRTEFVECVVFLLFAIYFWILCFYLAFYHTLRSFIDEFCWAY